MYIKNNIANQNVSGILYLNIVYILRSDIMKKDKKIWIIVLVLGLIIVLLNCLKLFGILIEDDTVYILASLIAGLGLIIASYMKLRDIK